MSATSSAPRRRWTARVPLLRSFHSARFRLALAALLTVIVAGVHAQQVGTAFVYWNQRADIHTVMGSARLIWGGRSPYEPVNASKSDFSSGQADRALYPPTTFVMLGPVQSLPDPFWRVAWLLVEEGALAIVLLAVYVDLGPPRPLELAIVLGLCVLFVPFRDGLQEGQFGTPLAALAALAVLAARRGRQYLGGLALGAAVAIKVVPALLLPYFVWRRRWRLVLAALAAIAATALATVALGWAPYWPGSLRTLGLLARGTADPGNQSIAGLVLRWLRPDLTGQPIPAPGAAPQAVITALDAALLAALGVGLWLARRAPEPQRTWIEATMVLLVAPMLEPIAWFHHLAGALVAIPVAGRLAATRRLGGLALGSLAAAWLAVSVAAYPLVNLAHTRRGGAFPPWLLAGASLTLIAVVVAAFALSAAASRLSRQQPV